MTESLEDTATGEIVVSASMEPMALLDHERYLSVNRAYATLFEVTDPERLKGEPWRQWFGHEARNDFEEEAIPNCRANGQWRGEVTGRQSDSECFPLDISLVALGEESFLCSARRAGTAGERGKRLGLITHLFDAIDDIMYVIDESGQSYFWNQALVETTGYSHEEIEGMSAMEFLPEDQHKYAPGLIEAIDAIEDRRIELDIRTKSGERIPHEFRGTTFTDARTGESFRFGIARDITDRLEREQRLERQRDELETLDRINELVLEITRELFQSPTRTEIEQAVCESLASSDLYRFAWIGGPDPNSDRLRHRASAGVDSEYVESTLTSRKTESSTDPGGKAFSTGTSVVSQDIRGDSAFEAWHDTVADHGIRSAIAVPLVHGDTTYGVLAVYSARPLAFSQREREGFESLGNAVAFAVNAIKTRQLLFADTVVELEFEVTDSDMVFIRVSDRLDCEITVSGFVESDSASWSVYATVEGCNPGDVREVAADHPSVSAARVIADEHDSGLLEVVLSGPALTELAEHGAILTAGHVDSGTGRFCVEAPQTTDIRQLTRRLQATYPNSTLVAQREFDRPAQRAMEIRQSLDEKLTDRQQEALKRAYLAGYFDWPRTSAAGDIAEMMGVSETTFHYHLRHGLDTLLANLSYLDHR